PIKETDAPTLVAFGRENRIDLVVVGPEAPLAAGLADALEEAGLRVFGPRQSAAEIESSKAFAKTLMRRAGVPTAGFERFRERDGRRSSGAGDERGAHHGGLHAHRGTDTASPGGLEPPVPGLPVHRPDAHRLRTAGDRVQQPHRRPRDRGRPAAAGGRLRRTP